MNNIHICLTIGPSSKELHVKETRPINSKVKFNLECLDSLRPPKMFFYFSNELQIWKILPRKSVTDDTPKCRTEDRIPVRPFEKSSDEKVNVVNVSIEFG